MSAKSPVIEAKRSGVYRAPADVDSLRETAVKAGLAWMELPLQTVTLKRQFMDVCAKQLKLPSYFGGNWDALADCLRDFNWLTARGFVLHVTAPEKFAKGAPDDYETALAVFGEAAQFWKGRGTPFVMLVDTAKDLPAF